MLPGVRSSRFIVAMQWFWSYLTFRRGARLITGAEGDVNGGRERIVSRETRKT